LRTGLGETGTEGIDCASVDDEGTAGELLALHERSSPVSAEPDEYWKVVRLRGMRARGMSVPRCARALGDSEQSVVDLIRDHELPLGLPWDVEGDPVAAAATDPLMPQVSTTAVDATAQCHLECDRPRSCPLRAAPTVKGSTRGLTPIRLVARFCGNVVPPVDSLLRRSMSAASGLSEEEELRLWSAAAGTSLRSIGVRDESFGPILGGALGADDEVEILLSTSFWALVTTLRADDGLLDRLIQQGTRWMSLELGRPLSLLANVPDWSPEFVPSYAAALPLAGLEGGAEHLGLFAILEVETVGELLSLSERGLMTVAGVTGPSLRLLHWMYALRSSVLGVAESQKQAGLEDPQADLVGFVRTALQAALAAGSTHRRGGDPRLAEILLMRSGLPTGKSFTLEQAGNALGVTRERVRQLETKALERLSPPEYCRLMLPVRMAVWASLRAHGGAQTQAELRASLAAEWGLTPGGEFSRTLVASFPECRTPEGETDLLVLTDQSCSACPELCEALVDTAELGEAVSVPAFLASLEEVCRTRPECVAPNEHALAVAVNESAGTAGRLSVTRGFISPVNATGHRPDTLVATVLRVLKNALGPMHFTEVARSVAECLPGRRISERHIYAVLGDSPDAVSWDRGSFIHASHMPFPYALVRSIEDWMGDRLSSGEYPMLSVHGVFEEFCSGLSSEGIPSELALYSLLRISSDARFVYPRYPRVYWSATYDERVPLTLAMTDYVLRAGGPVGTGDVQQFVVNGMGFKQFQFDQRITGLPGVLRTAAGWVHAENVAFDAEGYSAVLAYAERLVSERGHVSVHKVFEDRKVDCLTSGISDPELLYSLIRQDASHRLRATRYPLLATVDDERSTQTTIASAVESYIEEAQRPCSFDELDEAFVQARHYGPQSVFGVVSRPTVYRYTTGSVVHSATIDWGAAKQGDLERAARELYETAETLGDYVANVETLVERCSLPMLDRGLPWTPHLAAHMLQKGGRFVLVGNARLAFVPSANPRGIRDLGGLVAIVLRERFGGGVNLGVLEDYLREQRAIVRQITQPMLGQADVRIEGQEVVSLGGRRA
jgi:hypothetical protein